MSLLKGREDIYTIRWENLASGKSGYTPVCLKEVISAPQSPWQNPFVERIIGFTKRESTDYIIILNKAHLKNILSSYFQYYHNDRTHLSLEKDTPNSRPVEPKPADKCKIIALPRTGGLHHRDTWKRAA